MQKDLGKVGYTAEQLGLLKSSDNTTLADLIALNIGQIGENMVLRRGAGLFSADEKIKYCIYSLPINKPQINVFQNSISFFLSL